MKSPHLRPLKRRASGRMAIVHISIGFQRALSGLIPLLTRLLSTECVIFALFRELLHIISPNLIYPPFIIDSE